MRYTRIEEIPPLRDPVLLVAFAGWNDAASAATAAGKALIEKLAARYFAAIDGEEFYDFTSTRPIIDVKGDTQVSLEWPSNSFYYHADPALAPRHRGSPVGHPCDRRHGLHHGGVGRRAQRERALERPTVGRDGLAEDAVPLLPDDQQASRLRLRLRAIRSRNRSLRTRNRDRGIRGRPGTGLGEHRE
jgi:hypothetical protein